MDMDSEECRVYLVRRPDQREWLAKANAGDEVARLCVWAASNLMRAISQGRLVRCTCCETSFNSAVVPQAFIVLLPIKRDAEKVGAHAMGVCAECCKKDDQWLLDQGLKRETLSPNSPQSHDKIH